METIKITDYVPSYQDAINQMMKGIEAEFAEPITSPQSTRIHEVYQLPGQKFWVACCQTRVAGTAGLSLHANNSAVLKRMMVDKAFRGENYQTAKLLLDQAVEWAKRQGVKAIYLGTMEQFKAAQKFYVKHGFTQISKHDLPADYVPNPIDSLYYVVHLH